LALGEGLVFLKWLPQPHVRFVIPGKRMARPLGATPRLRVAEIGLTADVHVTRWPVGRGDIEGAINRARSEENPPIRELRFAVANLMSFRGEELLHEERVLPGGRTERSAWNGRLILEGSSWQLTLDERSDGSQVAKRLRSDGGHEVTHTAMLRHMDGSAFYEAEARDTLLAVSHFFGLVCGRWAAPLVAVGYDERAQLVWRDWNPPTTAPWSGVLSPFDVQHPEFLSEAFRGYTHAWQSDTWREPLLFATQMYVEANGPINAETSLVLTQAALELIAWVRFVEELKTYTAEEFDRVENRASGRLRELLQWLAIDPSIPATLAALKKEAERRNWLDAPHAIDWLRNALLHPSKRARIEDTEVEARLDLHEVALWYLELALLRVIGFRGAYVNRLGSRREGVVEPVPWRKTSPT
jgi:hypothetical protein